MSYATTIGAQRGSTPTAVIARLDAANTHRGCELISHIARQTAGDFLPIAVGVIPLTNDAGNTSRVKHLRRPDMTEDINRQRVLDFLDVVYSGDIEGALARCSDDIEFLANAPIDILPHMGQRRGKAEMRQMWTTIRSRYSGMRCEVPILIAEGDKVAVHLRVFFRKSSNERVVQFDIAAFYTLRDGKITRIREIIDTFDLVQQVLERDVAADWTGVEGGGP
jgi:ketosteroid isomerase-like protein